MHGREIVVLSPIVQELVVGDAYRYRKETYAFALFVGARKEF